MSSSSRPGLRKTNVNDLSSEGLTFSSIAIQDSGYTISGNALTLTNGLTYSGSGSSSYLVSTTYTGSSAITVSNGQLLHSGRVRLGVDATITVSAGSQITLSGGLTQSNTRNLQIAGAGLLILNSTASISGTTTVSGGVYQVDGSSTSSSVILQAGATLCGTGSVGNVSSSGGTITAGDQPGGIGTLLVHSLALDSSSTLSAQIVSASSYDQVQCAGAVSLGGATLNLSGGYSTSTADHLELIKNSAGSSVSNTFGGLPQDAAVSVGAGSFHISYQYNDGSTANNVVLSGVAATTTTLNVPASNPTYGQVISFTTNVMAAGSVPTPGSSIQLYIDSALVQTTTIDASGNATFVVSRLSAGSHTVYASYLGNSSYAPSQSDTKSVTVNQAGLTVTGVIATSRPYNATTTASLGTASAALSGVVGSDQVTLVTASAAGSFDTKNVGTGKTVHVSGLSISGADAANYVLTQPTVTANITQATLTVTGVTASNKTYDGTVNATIHTDSAALAGKFTGDTVVLNTSGAIGTFASKGVGTSTTVSIAGLSISGLDASNYVLTQPTTTANILAKTLTGSILAADKVYDETTAATISSRTLSGVVAGDDVSYVGGTAAFATEHIGTGIQVTASGLSLSGSDAGNYTVNSIAETTASIVAAPLTITPWNQEKTYGNLFTFTGTEFDVTGLIGEDTVTSVTLTSEATPANAHVSASPYAILASDPVGSGLEDYRITLVQGQFTIDPRVLTVTAAGQDKVYDTTTAATVTLSSNHLDGDSVTVADTSSTFADKNAGTGKLITVTGITIGGADAGNYELLSTSTTATASITAAGLTVTATGIDRTYDGTTAAAVTLADNHLGADVVNLHDTSASFSSKNVGIVKPIIVSGISIDGPDAGNYVLRDTSTTATATVSARELTGSITAQNKPYDETDAATIATRTLQGAVPGDDVSYVGGTATFDSIHVGTGIPVTATGLSLTGADAGNYSVNTTAATTADITLRPLTITPNPVVKVYGNTVTFAGTEFSVEGLLSDDTVTSVTLTSNGAGPAATVLGSPYAINAIDAQGTGLEDYDIQYVDGSLTVSPISLTVTSVTAQDREYDGTTTATINAGAANLVGVLEGDNVTLVTSEVAGQFADKNVGVDKPVSVSGLALAGDSASNYVLVQPGATASITAKALTGSITVLPKTWDGTTDATIATRTLSGVCAGDTVSYVGGVASFESPNVGTNIPVTATGLSLDGPDATNYTVNSTATTTGTISSQYVLVLTALAQTKTYGQTFVFDDTMFSAQGLLEGDSVTVTLGSDGAVSTANVGSSPYTITISDAVVTGPHSGAYDFDYVSGALGVTPQSVEVTDVSAANKVYDGTMSATLDTESAQLVGVINDDQVTLDTTGAVGQFADANAGPDKVVTVSGLTLGGPDAVNYAPAQPTTTAQISTKELTIDGATAQDKVYDRSTQATIDTGSAVLVGVVPDDDVSLISAEVTGAFADWNVGTAKPVTITGFQISGAEQSNYTLAEPSSSANITARELLATAQGQSKPYDGTTSATVTLQITPLAGDIVEANYALAAFTNGNAGTGKAVYVSGITLDGPDASNYALLNSTGATTADITTRELTGGVTVMEKVYDETDTATIATRTLAGVVPGDDVSLVGGTATFTSIHVGTGIPVSVTGLSLAGSEALNYTVLDTASTTADINPAALTITPSSQTKTYGNAFSFTGTEFTVQGLFPDDTVTSVALASSATPASAPASVTPYAIIASAAQGSGLDDYTISYVDGQFTVTARPLTVVAAAQNKEYDGTAAATVNLTGDPLSGDLVTINYDTATFDDKTASSDKTVTVTGITISGPDAGNYEVVDPTATTTASITPRTVTATATGIDRDYNGTTSATVNLSANTLGDDQVTVTYVAASFADKNVGTDKAVVVTGLALVGPDAGNYVLSATSTTATATVSARELTGSITAQNKPYDETDAATIATRTLEGAVPGDDVSYAGGTATFDSIHVGTGIPVTATGLSLAGADAGNYSVNTTAATTADITLRTLTITPNAVVKVYGNTVTFAGTEFSVEGLLSDDTVTSVTLTSNGAGPAATVLGSPYAINSSDAQGTGLDDYDIQYLAGTLNVTPRTLAVTATGIDRVYDGTVNAAVILTGNPISGDDVTVACTSSSFADKNVGTGKEITVQGLSLLGTAAPNYVLLSQTAVGSATITPRTMQVTATGENKVYDGSMTASVSLIGDPLEGDAVTLGYGLASFDSKDVGNDRQVVVADIAMGGADAGNYSLESTEATTTASITARPVTVSALPETKVYGTPDPTLAYDVTSGSVVAGDTFSGALTRTPGESVGVYPILVGSLTLGANYDMGYVGALFTITASTTGQVTTSHSQSYFGQQVAFTAQFTAPQNASFSMTGTVAFYDGLTYLGTSTLISNGNPLAASLPGAATPDNFTTMASGTALLPTSDLAVGGHIIRAVYSGDTHYSGAVSETPVNVQVIAATTTTGLTAVPSAQGTFLNASVVVTSPGNPALTGLVAFYEGTTLLGTAPLVNGMASLRVTGLTPGTHSFAAVYSGSESSSSSTTSTQVSTDGPRVIGVSRYGIHTSPTVLLLTFDGALDPARAQNPANYQIVDSQGARIPVTSAVYDPLTRSVQLHLARQLCLYRTYTLRVNGSSAGGLTGSTGIPLDGTGQNQPGTDFVTHINWRCLSLPGQAPAVTFTNGVPQTYAGRFKVYVGSILRAMRGTASRVVVKPSAAPRPLARPVALAKPSARPKLSPRPLRAGDEQGFKGRAATLLAQSLKL